MPPDKSREMDPCSMLQGRGDQAEKLPTEESSIYDNIYLRVNKDLQTELIIQVFEDEHHESIQRCISDTRLLLFNRVGPT